MSETVQDGFPSSEEVGDVMLGGGGGSTPTRSQVDPRAKEAAIMNDEPLYRFQLRTGTEIRIYSKSQGQLALIEAARRQYTDARLDYAMRSAAGWRWWRKRRKAMEAAIVRIHNAGLEYLRRVLEEPWSEEQSQEITAEDYRSIDHQQFVAILRAHNEANDVDDVMAEMDPEWEEKKTAIRMASRLAPSPAGSPQQPG